MKWPPLALYVHLPWCVRKCPYCDFNSFKAPLKIDQDGYVRALLADLDADLERLAPRRVQSVFFGGGTPSLFSPEQLRRFLDEVGRRIELAPDCEVTLEANPGTVEHAPFDEYRDGGITRVSLGVQSMDDRALSVLGRVHDVAAAERAMRQVAEAGFDSFNVDLMFALPEQTPESAVTDVQRVLAFNPPHVSYYHLTMEPGTLFAVRPPEGLPDADMAAEIESAGQSALAGAGLDQYEVSAWARKGHACRHNLNYWRFGDYLGIGAGAHGKLTLARQGRIIRVSKRRHPTDFIRRAGTAEAVDELRDVAGAELLFEYMLNRLRLRRPITLDEAAEATGLAPELFQAGLEKAQQKQLLRYDKTRGQVALTDLGWRFLSETQQCFLP